MNIKGRNTSTSTAASSPGIPEQPIDAPCPMVEESTGPIESSVGTRTPSAFCSNPRPPPGSRVPKNRSLVWVHFTRVPDCDPEEPIATCNHCGRQWKCHPKRQGTSAMKTHIQLCPKNRKSKLDKTQTFLVPEARIEGQGEKTLGMTKYNEKKIRAALARMVIVD